MRNRMGRHFRGVPSNILGGTLRGEQHSIGAPFLGPPQLLDTTLRRRVQPLCRRVAVVARRIAAHPWHVARMWPSPYFWVRLALGGPLFGYCIKGKPKGNHHFGGSRKKDQQNAHIPADGGVYAAVSKSLKGSKCFSLSLALNFKEIQRLPSQTSPKFHAPREHR